MLGIEEIKKLFNELNDGCDYCIYKGFDHIEQDLAGARGDIDICVSLKDSDVLFEILSKYGFIKSRSLVGKTIFIAPYNGVNGYLLLDLVIQPGSISDGAVIERFGVVDLRLHRSLSMCGAAPSDKFSYWGLLKRKVRRAAGMGAYSSKKGAFIAIVGTDGAGKSSLISYVENMKFFRLIGVKSIYFGANNFKTPFLKEVYEASVDSKLLLPLKLFAAMLMQFERRLRMVGVVYQRALGNVVIGDRYFYDDLVYQNLNAKNKSMMRGVVLKFLKLIEIQPDLIIYLDVDPEVAFQRKKDFELSAMYGINKEYKKLMKSVGAKFINANDDQDLVREKSVLSIMDILE